MATTTPLPSTEKRLYYLDWLRVFIIGGVFVAHALLPFTGGDWLIVSGSLIPIAGAIAIVGNQFGMPLLFVISGAATVFSMRRRTNKQYAKERFFRLVIPYIVMTILLSVMQAYFEALDHGRYSGSFIGYIPQFFTPHGITGLNLQWAGRYGYHLWFLVFLFFYAIVTIPLFTYLRSEKGQRWYAWFDRVFRLPGAIVWLPGLVLGVIAGIVYIFFPGYQDWGDTVYWGIFFVYGYILYSDPRLLEHVRRSLKASALWIFLTIAALAAVALITLLSVLQVTSLTEVSQLPGVGISYLLKVVLCFNSWAFMILFLALGMRFLNFTNKYLKYLGEAAMPFYLLHHPVIVFIAFYVTHIPISPGSQLIITGISSWFVTGALYHLFLRRWNPLRMALGMSRLKPGEMPTTRKVWVERIVFGGAIVVFACVIVGMLPFLGVTTYTASAASLPNGWTAIAPGSSTICADGTPYQFFMRPVTDSQKLLIYFQSGGACWNEATCGAKRLAYAKAVDYSVLDTYRGIFDFNHPENPVADYNIVFVTYCTADMHTGARDIVFNATLGTPQQVHFQGYLNSLAALNWAFAQYPQPEKVVIAGSGAGAVGSIFFSNPIMRQYAAVPVVQLGDGYAGVMPDDWSALETWGTRANVPGALRQPMALSSPASFATTLYASSAKDQPQRTFGQFTTAADATQIDRYAVAGGQAREWPDQLWSNLSQLNNESNFRSFVAAGAEHSILPDDRFYTTQVNGVRFRDWFASLLDGQLVENVACARGSTLLCP